MPDNTLRERTDRDVVCVVDLCGPKEACAVWECTLAQPGEYD